MMEWLGWTFDGSFGPIFGTFVASAQEWTDSVAYYGRLRCNFHAEVHESHIRWLFYLTWKIISTKIVVAPWWVYSFTMKFVLNGWTTASRASNLESTITNSCGDSIVPYCSGFLKSKRMKFVKDTSASIQCLVTIGSPIWYVFGVILPQGARHLPTGNI